jgi:molecular chaperone DnaK (HSP70)
VADLSFLDCKLRFGCSVTAGLETRRSMQKVGENLGFAGFGFNDVREEPVLASLPYLKNDLHPGEILLVYDFGGGTFDTAVIRIDSLDKDGKPAITVLSEDGEPFCGGTDIDRALAEYLARRITREYFNDDSIKMKQINDKLMEGRARDVKELLSSQQSYRLILPPGFMGRANIAIDITREQFDRVLNETGLLEKSTRCVLRAWQIARMVYRKQDEEPNGLNLKEDQTTGYILKDFTDIDYVDLNANLNRVLLVGGTTKIPLIQKHLASILDQHKFISESNPSHPLVACSLGAASRKEHVNSVINRLPFSIIIRDGINYKEMYRAYVPTVYYRVITDNPRIESFTSHSVCTVSGNDSSAFVELIDPDGRVLQMDNLDPGRYILEIDCYGRIFLKPIMMEINNPAQHELQKIQLIRLKYEAARKQSEEDKRTGKYLGEKPGEEGGTG